MSVLCQFYGSVRSVLCQFYGSVRSVLCQFYVRGYAPRAAPVWIFEKKAAAAPYVAVVPSTVRSLARGPRVLIGWPLPLGLGLDGRLLLARRGRVYV